MEKTFNEEVTGNARHESLGGERSEWTPIRRREPSEFPDEPLRKFASAGFQIRQATLGHTESIACPYCLSTVILGEQTLCCDQMGKATETFLSHIEIENPRQDVGRKYKRKPAANRLVPITAGTALRWGFEFRT
jgi:hypothetical protein